MDRIWFALLLGCGLLGFGLTDAQDVESNTPANPQALPAVASAPPTPAHTEALPEASEQQVASALDVPTEDPVIRQIVARFAMRHTALPERERITLAHTIVREAKLHGLEPDLIMAVIEVESAGYHLAVSHVGALGLMQLLPSTAEELAGKLDIEWMGPDTLFDPTTNIRLGSAYLRELANRYDGDVNTALAAYNWGPGRIDRRIRRGDRVPSKYIEQVRSAVDRYAMASLSTRS